MSAVLLAHHLLLDELGMAPLSPHPRWWCLHLLLVLLMAPILLILALLLLQVIACLAGPSGEAPPPPFVHPDIVR